MIFNVGQGSGSGKLVHLNISYDVSLAGATITATNGSEVHTATANESGLTVISGKSLGEWTISEDSLGTSVTVVTTFYGNYIASVGGDRFITVTYESAFEGKIITCTNGTDTQTRVASGGSVQFCFMNDGTYTISATIDSNTYSTNVTVNGAGTYTANLVTTPDGSTVTPVNDIRTWLKCAGLNKSYTGISQVLADSTTLSALIADNNAVDYLVRSTDWAEAVCANESAMTYIGLNDYCANKLLANSTWATAICNSEYFESVLNVKVPTSTSNTSSMIGLAGNREFYLAYDNDSSTYYMSKMVGGVWLGYKFDKPISIRVVNVYITLSYTIKVDYSDDGSTWSTAWSFDYTKNTNKVSKSYEDHGYHTYWRISGMGSTSNYTNIYTLQFYGREEV